MKKLPFFIGLLICFLLYACFLKPLPFGDFDIETDETLLMGKQKFLLEMADKPEKKQPNIIVILVDDLGYMDISLHGNPNVQTPNIDALAREGTSFQNAYVTSAVCAPSRAGMITGRYQHRFGIENQEHDRYLKNKFEYLYTTNFVKTKPWQIQKMNAVPSPEAIAKQGLPPSEISLAEILKKEGYKTGITGKWNLGNTEFSRPMDFGFDEQYGFYGTHSLYAPEGSPGIIDLKNPEDWTDQYIWKSQRTGKSAIFKNGEVVEEKGYLTQRFADEAINFLETNQDKPFFLFVPFSAPHTPFQVPDRYMERVAHIQDPVQRIYYAMISSLDDAVGAIHSKVKELGMEDNTLLFFLSDNGGAAYTLATDNGNLKGGKVTGFDGGLRVPFFVKWKGVIPANSKYDKPISSLDIFATACAAADADLPEDRVYDGVSLLPYIIGEKTGLPHPALYWKAAATRIILKDGWKLIFDDKWGQTLLYNLTEDPFEKKNIASENPDLVRQLKDDHFLWAKDFPKPLWPHMITFIVEDETGVYYFEI